MEIWHVFMTLLAFGVIIFIHEGGHFLAAKRVGIRVEKFYLGFDFWGLKLFKFHHKGTEYGIGVFPLGGYVKLAGQEDFGKPQIEGKPDEFTSKNVWQRMQVLAGGVVFNFLSAFLFCFLALLAGFKITTSEIGMVEPGSAAWHVGLKEGDEILSYNRIPVNTFDSLRTEVVLTGAEGPFPIKYKRNGEIKKAMIQPKVGHMGLASIGVEPASSLEIRGVKTDSGAAKAGVLPGDRVLKINDQKIEKWEDMSPIIQKIGKMNGTLNLTVERKGKTKTFDVGLLEDRQGFLGIEPKLSYVIQECRKDSPAQKSGFKLGMKILGVNGKSLADYLKEKPSFETPGLVVEVEDQGQKRELKYANSFKALTDDIFFMGIDKTKPIVINKVFPGTAAEKIGLKAGDKIDSLKVEGEKMVESPMWIELSRFVSLSENKEIFLLVDREGKKVELNGTIGTNEEVRYYLGIIKGTKSVDDISASTVLLWPFNMLRMSYKSLWSLITGIIPTEHISGPIGILRATYQFSSVGIDYLLYLMALISIHIAFFNVLPLPVLDGGHLMFCLIEAVKGKPVSQRVMNKLQYAGLVLLLFILMFATYNDSRNIFNEWF